MQRQNGIKLQVAKSEESNGKENVDDCTTAV